MTEHAHGGPAATAESRDHRHLDIVKPKVGTSWRRLLVIALAVCSVGTFVGSLGQPWWKIKLYAPQYPHGLQIVISLTGVGGDVAEINELNHYIGMGHLDEAAPVERKLAGFGIATVSIMVVAFTLIMGRKLGVLMLVAGALLPLGFLVDSYYWMRKYGHGLDPHAPLRIPPFTPELFGNGTIGQFMTFAQPERGFWLAIGGVMLLAAAAFLRGRVCATCAARGTCGAVCKTAFVVGPKSEASASGGAG
ncbi:MAG TPA: hypothetical protein VF331_22855 [Polyangiales bacterium]